MQKRSFKEIEVDNEVHYLYPSNLMVSKTPLIIKTVLGSCISVCLWDPQIRTGGMNHFMLPLWNGEGLPSPKYGNIAIEKLIEKMLSLGCQKKYLIAKVFGGAENLHDQKNFFRIGLKNITIATEILNENNIPIKGKSVGGNQGRNIIFNTYTGEVRLKYINKGFLTGLS